MATARNRNGRPKQRPVDESVRAILGALEREYKSCHPGAKIEGYRRYPHVVRVRIVDRDFSGLSRSEREDIVWPIIESLPSEVRDDLHILLLLTPDEQKTSPMNAEFDNPVPDPLLDA